MEDAVVQNLLITITKLLALHHQPKLHQPNVLAAAVRAVVTVRLPLKNHAAMKKLIAAKVQLIVMMPAVPPRPT